MWLIIHWTKVSDDWIVFWIIRLNNSIDMTFKILNLDMMEKNGNKLNRKWK